MVKVTSDLGRVTASELFSLVTAIHTATQLDCAWHELDYSEVCIYMEAVALATDLFLKRHVNHDVSLSQVGGVLLVPAAGCWLATEESLLSFCKKMLCLDLAVDSRLIVVFSLIKVTSK